MNCVDCDVDCSDYDTAHFEATGYRCGECCGQNDRRNATKVIHLDAHREEPHMVMRHRKLDNTPCAHVLPRVWLTDWAQGKDTERPPDWMLRILVFDLFSISGDLQGRPEIQYCACTDVSRQDPTPSRTPRTSGES